MPHGKKPSTSNKKKNKGKQKKKLNAATKENAPKEQAPPKPKSLLYVDVEGDPFKAESEHPFNSILVPDIPIKQALNPLDGITRENFMENLMSKKGTTLDGTEAADNLTKMLSSAGLHGGRDITKEELRSGESSILSRRIDAHVLAKLLPNTCNDLYNGHITQDEFLDSLLPLIIPPLEVHSEIFDNASRPKSITFLVSAKLFEYVFYGDYSKEFLAAGRTIREELLIRFGPQGMAKHLEKRLSLQNMYMPTNSNIKHAFDETMRQMADYCDHYLFEGREGTFLRESRLYPMPIRPCNANHEKYTASWWQCLILDTIDRNELIDRMNEQRLNIMQYQAMALAIANGVHLSRKMCWKCKACPPTLSECTKCGVASYCSTDCQHRDWSGHKKQCKYAKTMIQFTAHGMTVVASNTDESENSGYEMMYKGCCRLDQPLLEQLQGIAEGPSMEVFYKNLKLLVDGEKWLFPSSAGPCNKSAEYLRPVYALIGAILCFDVFTSLDTEAAAKALATDIVLKSWGQDLFDGMVSAEQFIANFRNENSLSFVLKRKETQSGFKYRIKQILYLHCHPAERKKSPLFNFGQDD